MIVGQDGGAGKRIVALRFGIRLRLAQHRRGV
jgi:hypothetical protein